MLRAAKPANVDPEIVWRPIPGTSQEFALDTRCHHTLYTGARGPGKTDTQLMRFRRRVGLGYGSFWRGIIFDKEYKNLDDLVTKSKRWFPKFNDGCRFLESKSDYKWVWPTGEELLFRSIRVEADYWNYHGHEYPFIGWNELAKYANAGLYDKMMSCNRSSFTPEKDSPRDERGIPLLDKIPLEVFSTTNPYGPGHTWVKVRFIDPAPYGKVVKTSVDVFNPQTQRDETIVKTQVAIFGSYRENIYLSPEYVATLAEMDDENIRKAWMFGDWNVIAGGAFDDVWSPKTVLPRFAIPSGWRVDRSFDWGSTHPFATVWFAEANGEEATLPDGTKFCPPAGSLIIFHEYYGTAKPGTNKGLKLDAHEIAAGIIKLEIELLENDWIEHQPSPGPADNQIRDVREKDVDTIEKKMADDGVRWTASDKSPGSRKIGLELARGMLKAVKHGLEKPGLYVMDHCRSVIALVPSLPRGENDKIDDVDTDAEDHLWDAIRYRVLAGSNRYATKLLVTLAH